MMASTSGADAEPSAASVAARTLPRKISLCFSCVKSENTSRRVTMKGGGSAHVGAASRPSTSTVNLLLVIRYFSQLSTKLLLAPLRRVIKTSSALFPLQHRKHVGGRGWQRRIHPVERATDPPEGLVLVPHPNEQLQVSTSTQSLPVLNRLCPERFDLRKGLHVLVEILLQPR